MQRVYGILCVFAPLRFKNMVNGANLAESIIYRSVHVNPTLFSSSNTPQNTKNDLSIRGCARGHENVGGSSEMCQFRRALSKTRVEKAVAGMVP